MAGRQILPYGGLAPAPTAGFYVILKSSYEVAEPPAPAPTDGFYQRLRNVSHHKGEPILTFLPKAA